LESLSAARVAWQEKGWEERSSGTAKERVGRAEQRNSERATDKRYQGEVRRRRRVKNEGKKGCEKASRRYPYEEGRQIHDDGVDRRCEWRGAFHTISAHEHTHTHAHARTTLTTLTAHSSFAPLALLFVLFGLTLKLDSGWPLSMISATNLSA
jgi:hypothetical protein